MHAVTIVTDGSCPLGNPGPGGWASIVRWGMQEIIIIGSHPATTNNRGELMGAIDGLRALKVTCRVTVITDSQYVKQGITEWLPRWLANSWKSSSGKPVLNQHLWCQLAELAQRHEVEWSWTSGHRGDDKDQNRGDHMAAQAAREQALASAKR